MQTLIDNERKNQMDVSGIKNDDVQSAMARMDQVIEASRRIQAGQNIPYGFSQIAQDPNAETIEKQRLLIAKLSLEKHDLEQKLKAMEPALNGSVNRTAGDRGYE